jgi:hypothetical protein
MLYEPSANLYRCDARDWQTKKRSQPSCQHFIGEHPDMLGIVLEFRDVAPTIGGPKKLGLRSATQTTNMLDRRDARAHKHLLEFLEEDRMGRTGLGWLIWLRGDWTGVQQRVVLYAGTYPAIIQGI